MIKKTLMVRTNRKMVVFMRHNENTKMIRVERRKILFKIKKQMILT